MSSQLKPPINEALRESEERYRFLLSRARRLCIPLMSRA